MSDQAEPEQQEDKAAQLRERWVTNQLNRYRTASYLLLSVAAAVALYVILVVTKVFDTPSWQLVVLVAFVAGCVALPLLNKFSLSKDGGSFEPFDPVSYFDAVEERAQETRVASFESTRQQVSALSLQIEELKELVLKTSPTESGIVAEEAVTSRKHSFTLQDARKLLPAVTNEKDPQKGRFGGSNRDNSRVLTATVSPSPFGKKWQNIVFALTSADGSEIRGDYVYFFMHDTFDPEVYRVKVKPGARQVKLSTSAVGAFTAGVAADEGDTLLEIDLASSEVQAPDWWKDR